MKHNIERILHTFGVHSFAEVKVDPVRLVDHYGGGIYDITSMCRVCKKETRDLVYRREQPIIDLDLMREYYRKNKS